MECNEGCAQGWDSEPRYQNQRQQGLFSPWAKLPSQVFFLQALGLGLRFSSRYGCVRAVTASNSAKLLPSG